MRISDWSSDVCSSDLHKKIGPAIGCPGGFELDAGRGKVMPRSPQVDTRHAGCDPRQKSCDFRVALICGSRNLQYPVRCDGRKQVVDLTAVTRIIVYGQHMADGAPRDLLFG